MATYTGYDWSEIRTGSTYGDLFYRRGGNDTVHGFGGSDTIHGEGDADRLYGGDASDVLHGGDGNDTLLGEASPDDVIGGSGDDLLVGGQGADGNSGGAGRDLFRMWDAGTQYSPSAANVDWIHDFNQWEGDRIDLLNIDAKESPWYSPFDGGKQAFSWRGNTGGATLGKGELGYVHSDGTTYVYGNTDGDSAAEFTIGLTGTLYLQSTDFILSLGVIGT